MAEKYVKLGEKANSFYDPATGLTLIPGEIKQVPNAFLRTQRTRRFLKGAGIVYASKEEFNEYQEKLNPPEVKYKTTEKLEEEVVEEKPKTRKEELEELTKAALLEQVESSSWEEGDVEKAKSFKKKAELIDFIVETEKLYE